MLDTSYLRTPELLSKIKFSDGKIPQKWQGRQSITGWYLDEKDRIILQAVPKKEEIDAAHTLKSLMNEDLSLITPYLRLAKYPSEFGELDVGNAFLEIELEEESILQRPFPGMAFYTENDAKIFKGRDTEVEKLLSVISTWPITILIGESGAGKTSLIHAGLFPKLKYMAWKFVWTRPFDNPNDNLKKMIWQTYFEGEVDTGKSLLDVIRESAEKSKPHNLLIVIDQFEDVLNCNEQGILNDLSLTLMAIQTLTIMPNIRLLLSFREDASVKLNSRLLKRITGSARQFPSVELEQLTRDGAKSAFLSGLENAKLGLDMRQEEGQKQLIEIILDDIQKEDDRFYPPYIQMVAETLCKKIDLNNPIITREIYVEQLKGAQNIIAHYLMELLNEFGSQKETVKKILISLTSSIGNKTRKRLIELSKETEIAQDELERILNKMIDIRIVRAVGDDEFEIIHDYLSKIINEELVNEEERIIKFLEEQLNSFCQNYKIHNTPIISLPFMVSLYKNRRKIKIDEEKYPLILATCLLGESKGLGWYWLKDIDVKIIFKVIKEHIPHGIEEIMNEVLRAFKIMATSEDMDKTIEMLYDKDQNIRKTAIEVFEKIATHKERDKVIEMLYNKDTNLRRIAEDVLIKIAEDEDRNKVIEMLDAQNSNIRMTAVKVLGKIGVIEDVDKIIKMLYSEKGDIRIIVGETLKKIAIHDNIDKIVEMLSDEDDYIRSTGIIIFSNIATYEDRNKIIEMLHFKYGDVRKLAVEILGKIGKPEDMDKIIEMLHDSDWIVRKSASEAFENIVVLMNRNKMIEKLYDKDGDIRNLAGEVFLKTATREDKDRINNILRDNYNWDIRRLAAKALKKIATHEDMDKIIEMLNDKDSYIQVTAKETLIKIASHEDMDKIIEMLSDRSWDIRRIAIEKFSKIATHEDRHKLIKMSYNTSWDVRRAVIEALRNIATHEDMDKIIEMLYDVNSDIRRVAVEIFRNIATHEDMDKIIEMSRNNDWDIQETARKAFRKITTSEDRDKIIRMLSNNYWYIRRIAAEALGNVFSYEDRDKIIEMLYSVNGDIKRLAAEAFEKIATHDDMDETIKMLRDNDWYITMIAVKTFRKIATHEDMDKIIEMLYYENSVVQNSAREFLGDLEKPEDIEYLLDLLTDKAQCLNERQRDYLKLLIEFDRKFYCPYFNCVF